MRALIILLTEDAACKDADPSLFDDLRPTFVHQALSYCQRCTVVKECEAFVRPRKSFYDGTAAGKFWRNGRIVDPDQDELFEAVN